MISRKGWNRQRAINTAKASKDRKRANWFKTKIAGKEAIDFFYNGSGLFSASPFPIMANSCVRAISDGLVFQPSEARDQTKLQSYYPSLCSNNLCVIVYTLGYLKPILGTTFKDTLHKCLYYIQFNNGNTASGSEIIAEKLLSKYESWF